MGQYIGVDLGTTSVTALLLDTASGDVLARQTAPNDAETTTAEDHAMGRSEWDIERMIEITVGLLGTLVKQAEIALAVEGIGVTGQQHGMVLLDRHGQPCTPFIGWQDRRCLDTIDGGQNHGQNRQGQRFRGHLANEGQGQRFGNGGRDLSRLALFR